MAGVRPELMSAVVDSASEGIITMDASASVISFNPAAELMFGHLADEVIGRDISMLMAAECRQGFHRQLQRFCEAGQPPALDEFASLKGVRKGGDTFPLDWSISAMQVDGQQLFVVMVRDATGQQQQEKRLRHVQKMEAVGELVGGVAHNFNNLLAAIVGNVGLARFEARGLPQLIGYLDNIEEVSLRAGRMVEQLLVFASRDYFQRKQTIPLAPLVREGFDIARLDVSEDVDISLDIRDEMLAVYGDANQLRQVVVNIIDNARLAVEESADRRIRVLLERFKPDADFFIQHFELEEGDYARLLISDSGCGMDAKTMVRMFEPFFTTREVGKGIGLGLSTAFGTISSHDGVIDVDSTLGAGTTFNIYLPLVETGIPEWELPEDER